MATQLALLYLLDIGASERPIDFVKDYRASWLSVGVLGKISISPHYTYKFFHATIFRTGPISKFVKMYLRSCGKRPTKDLQKSQESLLLLTTMLPLKIPG